MFSQTAILPGPVYALRRVKRPRVDAAYVQNGCNAGRRKSKSPRREGRQREEEGTGAVSRAEGAHGTPCAALVLHAFRMATGFTVPSQGRRGTAPLNQLCHFYARRLIFVEFYYLQCVCLLPRARALCAYVGGRLLLRRVRSTYVWRVRAYYTLSRKKMRPSDS